MNRKLILIILTGFLYANLSAQEIKFRLGGNFGTFSKESGPEEVLHPLVVALSNPNATEFVYDYNPGFDAELMLRWTPNIETGIEFKTLKFSGTNEVPPYYNYYFAPDNPNVITTTEPMMFESSASNLLLNFRYYLAPEGKISPFVKAFGGLSFVAAEFNYQDTSVWDAGESGVLYAVGTENSDEPKVTALNYGAGAGFNFKFSEQLSLYVDGYVSVINTDILDGIPNYDYIAAEQALERADNKAMTYGLSLGIVFSTKADLGLTGKGGGKKKGSSVKRSGRTLPYRPFYRQK